MELYELQYSRSLGVNLGARQYIGNSTAINSNHFLNLKIVRQQHNVTVYSSPHSSVHVGSAAIRENAWPKISLGYNIF